MVKLRKSGVGGYFFRCTRYNQQFVINKVSK